MRRNVLRYSNCFSQVYKFTSRFRRHKFKDRQLTLCLFHYCPGKGVKGHSHLYLGSNEKDIKWVVYLWMLWIGHLTLSFRRHIKLRFKNQVANVRSETALLKPYSNQLCGRYFNFSMIKVFTSGGFPAAETQSVDI